MSKKTKHKKPKHSVKIRIPVTFLPELLKAAGKCDYPMTNDYIFRAVLQTNNLALKGLVSALLHIPPEHIFSVEITNPIALGDSHDAKEYRLDINVVLNNHTLINLEMQMEWQSDWHERSLVYLCRNFDSLTHGENYENLKPAVHIGILNNAPAYEGNEFYSEHMLMNVKSHKIYSDKLSLRVLRLDCIENATAEDKAWKIDRWAKFFKADTWEDIMTIAEHDEYLLHAANSLYLLNADEIARKRARDREDYYRDKQAFEALKVKSAEQAALLAEKDASLAEKDASLAEKDASLAEKDASLAEKDASLAEKDASLAEKDALIAELQAKLAEKNS